MRRGEALTGLAFVSPFIVGFVLFSALPMIASFILSLTDFDPRDPEATQFIGLDNYRQMLNDPALIQALGVTIRFGLITVPLSMGVALGLAILVNSTAAERPERLPDALLPADAHPDRGQHARLDRRPPRDVRLAEHRARGGRHPGSELAPGPQRWVGPALALMGLWGIGNMMLIFLAGLQGVPTELYDAAKVDGAGAWARFRHVTLPMISPVLFYNVIIALIATFQYFTQAYVVSNGRGDPDQATLFINLYLYRQAFGFFNMGYASALAWLLFVIVLFLTIILFRTSGRWVFQGGDR